MRRVLLTIVFVTTLPLMSLAIVDGQTCQPFYRALEKVPHESIFQREDMYNSRLFETSAKGCFVVMNTSQERLAGQTMPDFSGTPGTMLYQEGWRVNPKYAADGPGGSVTGLEKEEALCLVFEDQPTYRNDDGKVAGGEFIRIRVECMEGSKGSSPKLILREAQ